MYLALPRVDDILRPLLYRVLRTIHPLLNFVVPYPACVMSDIMTQEKQVFHKPPRAPP